VPSPSWTAADLADQQGRRIVITGGNSGIGLVAARLLAGAGAQVTIAVRDQAKGEQAATEIGGDTEVRALDLADLNSVRAFAAETSEPIDVLINNAGVMATPLGRTAQGFETQFGVNHLGHFALTNLLLPKITDRVVAVASGAHRRGHIDLDDLNWERRSYQRWAAYGQSKLANLLFVLELERRLVEIGSSIRATAAHPGYAATNLQGHSGHPRVDRAAMALSKLIAQPAEGGAWSTLFAATADIPGGSYVGPGGRNEMRGVPTLVGRSRMASDVELARQLWTASEQLTGVRFPAEALAE